MSVTLDPRTAAVEHEFRQRVAPTGAVQLIMEPGEPVLGRTDGPAGAHARAIDAVRIELRTQMASGGPVDWWTVRANAVAAHGLESAVPYVEWAVHLWRSELPRVAPAPTAAEETPGTAGRRRRFLRRAA